MNNLLKLYREDKSPEEMAKLVTENIQSHINCETVSVFGFNDASQQLILLYSTSVGSEAVIDKSFGPKTTIFSQFEDEEDRIICSETDLAEYPTTDIYFEDITMLVSVAYSRVLDCYENPIGIVRGLNKLDNKKKPTLFTNEDLLRMTSVCNIFGAALSARQANQIMLSFLDSVTHELLAPMTGVKNTSRMLLGYLNNVRDSEQEKLKKVNESLKEINRFSELSISLVQNLTMFSFSGRMEKRDLRPRPTLLYKRVINPSIRNLRALLHSRKFRKENILVEKFWNIPELNIDRKAMLQVFTNILHNCIKYAFEDPSLFKVEISHKINNRGDLNIYISDYGIGIDSNFAPKIFQPGERGIRAKKNLPTGTGIGLTTVRKLLNLHEMTIKLISNNQPTIFLLTIPKKLIIKRRL
jgi:signal transduction histidine kinase